MYPCVYPTINCEFTVDDKLERLHILHTKKIKLEPLRVKNVRFIGKPVLAETHAHFVPAEAVLPVEVGLLAAVLVLQPLERFLVDAAGFRVVGEVKPYIACKKYRA